MAKKKRKHGKVEARQARARVRFKPGVLVAIVLLTFLACFAAYLISATTTEGYWENEIVAEMEREEAAQSAGKPARHANVTNPVPSSERAEDSRMGEVAFIGDIAAFVNYYETNSGMVFTDAIVDMSESRMRSIARSLYGTQPKAVYLWYQCPSDLENGAAHFEDLVDAIMEQIPGTPVYVLTATPASTAEENQKIETWNAALFAMADEIGLHYVDVSTTLKANDGTLAPAYAEDEQTLYTTVGELILTHIAD